LEHRVDSEVGLSEERRVDSEVERSEERLVDLGEALSEERRVDSEVELSEEPSDLNSQVPREILDLRLLHKVPVDLEDLLAAPERSVEPPERLVEPPERLVEPPERSVVPLEHLDPMDWQDQPEEHLVDHQLDLEELCPVMEGLSWEELLERLPLVKQLELSEEN
jgi:hypothetical protein